MGSLSDATIAGCFQRVGRSRRQEETWRSSGTKAWPLTNYTHAIMFDNKEVDGRPGDNDRLSIPTQE